MELTSQQQRVVDSESKRIIVLACAGSGKTAVITQRIAKLWERGVKPEQILALTFSNKAAQEMKKRICKEDAQMGAKVNVRTFHAFGLDIIRKYNLALDFSDTVKIVKPSEKRTIIKEILRARNLDAMAGTGIETYIQKCKSCEPYKRIPDYHEVFEAYQSTLTKRNLVDMDDMIWLPVRLLSEHTNVREIVANQYCYIFVDENQDTNEAQSQLLDLITTKETSICLVGDDDQAIYEWRGAKPQYIRDKANSGDYELIRLEVNFRSQQGITDVANSIISKNQNRVKKRIMAKQAATIAPLYKRLATQEMEAAYIAQRIRELLDNNKYHPSDIAILCRVNSQISLIKEALDFHGIECDLCEIDENAQYGRFVSVLQSIVSLNSVIDLGNAINFPDNCFDNFIFMDAQEEYVKRLGCDPNYTDLEWVEALYQSDLRFENCELFRERYGLISQLHRATNWLPTQIMALYIAFMEQRNYEEKYPEQYHFLLQVFDIAKNYEEAFGPVSLQEFLYHLTLTINSGDVAKGNSKDSVSVMTMHRAKGLEFKVVFIIGVQVGVFPNDYFMHTEDDIEAERRLFYVAITRAKELLFMTSYKDPLGGGKTPIVTHGFMAEIPQTSFRADAEFKEILKSLPDREERVQEAPNFDEILKVIRKMTGTPLDSIGTVADGYAGMVTVLKQDTQAET